MPFKEHKFFPPSLKSICSFWGTIIAIALTAWGISYFAKWNIPFLYILLIIIALFLVNLIIDYHLEYKTYQELKDKYDSVANEGSANSSIKVKDGERGINLEVNGNKIVDPDLKELVHITVERYKHSNEEERKKWIEEGRKEMEDYILNHKW